MTENKPLNFTTRIKSLEMISFAIEQTPKELKVNSDKITFGIGIEILPNEQDRTFTITNPIDIFSDESKSTKLGSLQVKGEFIIENWEEVKLPDGIPAPIVATYVGVVLSSARGMLRILSKGTSFESAIIPIINPMAMLGNLPSPNPTPTKTKKPVNN